MTEETVILENQHEMTAFYIAKAHQMRAEAARDGAHTIGAFIKNLFVKTIDTLRLTSKHMSVPQQ